MITGYARLSTEGQNLSVQLDAPNKAGCEKIYQEKTSSTQAYRPSLEEMMNYLRKGAVFLVWKLDRLGRSIKEFSHLVSQLYNLKNL